MSKPAKKRPTASAPPPFQRQNHRDTVLAILTEEGRSRLEAIARHRLAAITHGRNDRSDDEGHRLAAALGARFSCRRVGTARMTEARSRRPPSTSDANVHDVCKVARPLTWRHSGDMNRATRTTKIPR